MVETGEQKNRAGGIGKLARLICAQMRAFEAGGGGIEGQEIIAHAVHKPVTRLLPHFPCMIFSNSETGCGAARLFSPDAAARRVKQLTHSRMMRLTRLSHMRIPTDAHWLSTRGRLTHTHAGVQCTTCSLR